MIYTRFGSPVKLIYVDYDKGNANVIRISDKKEMVCSLSELKADVGSKEIEAEARKEA